MVGRSTSQPRLPLVKGTRSGLRSGCLVTGRSIILTTFWALDLLSFPWTDEGRTGIPACPERQAGYVFKRPFGVAGFQPAVSRVSNPQTLRRLQSLGTEDGSADWKSAIQQVGNRYRASSPPSGIHKCIFLQPGSLNECKAKQVPGWSLSRAPANIQGDSSRAV